MTLPFLVLTIFPCLLAAITLAWDFFALLNNGFCGILKVLRHTISSRISDSLCSHDLQLRFFFLSTADAELDNDSDLSHVHFGHDLSKR